MKVYSIHLSKLTREEHYLFHRDYVFSLRNKSYANQDVTDLLQRYRRAVAEEERIFMRRQALTHPIYVFRNKEITLALSKQRSLVDKLYRSLDSLLAIYRDPFLDLSTKMALVEKRIKDREYRAEYKVRKEREREERNRKRREAYHLKKTTKKRRRR